MSSAPAWFEMPSPFDCHGERVLLLEPDWAVAEELRRQLLDESYTKPYVVEDGERRYLHFNGRLIQSAMRMAAPNELDLRYTQKMAAFLLFRPKPRHIVLIGLGGGSLVKFFRHRFPATEMTVLENNPHVIAWRTAFLVPPDSDHLSTHEADGAAFLAQITKGIDVLLVDAFDNDGLAPSIAHPSFVEQAYAKLAGSGVLVVNLAGEEHSCARLTRQVREVFADQVIVFPVREDDNHVLLAFKDPQFEPNWPRLRPLARELRTKYGLDFPCFLDIIERSAKNDLAELFAGKFLAG